MATPEAAHFHRSSDRLQADSRPVTSTQQQVHPKLPALVRRYLDHPYRKPVPDHTLRAFEQLGEFLATGEGPVILDSFCGTGHSTSALAARFPGHRVIGVENDSHGIAEEALEELGEACDAVKVPCLKTTSALDTTQGARNLSEHDCIATLILGGDGTSRAFVKGWRDAVLLPLSTGTNNVFPRFAEATVAGAAAGAFGGRKAQQTVQSGKVQASMRQRCETVMDTQVEVIGYDVRYELDGQVSTVRMDYHPGKRIAVDNGQMVI